MSDESIKPPSKYNKMFNPSVDYVGTKMRVKFSGDWLKITFKQVKIVNIYVAYEIEESIKITSYPTLKNCLFGSVKLTKNIDVDHFKYSGCGIRFHRKRSYSIDNEVGRNVITFWSRYEFISTYW